MVDQNLSESRSKTRRVLITIFTWTVLISGGLLFWVFWPYQSFQDETLVLLADEFYQPPSVQIHQRSNEPSLLRKGMMAYADEDWNQAVEHFSGIKRANEDYLEAHFFLGHSYYRASEYLNAAKVFSEMSEFDHPYVQQAEWFNILARMHYSTRVEILPPLEQISFTSGHFYQGRAKALIGRIPSG